MHTGDTNAILHRSGPLDAVALPGWVGQPVGLPFNRRLRSAMASRGEGRSPATWVDAAHLRMVITAAYQALGAIVAFVVVTFPLLLIGYLLVG